MPPTSTLRGERALDTAWEPGDLPDLTTIDRFALRLGLALILWGQRHAERAERAEQARASSASDRAQSSRDEAFERRAAAGPTW